MNFEEYRNKKATIKSTEVEGTITDVKHKRGANNRLAARFIVTDDNGQEHELMPHEITIHK